MIGDGKLYFIVLGSFRRCQLFGDHQSFFHQLKFKEKTILYVLDTHVDVNQYRTKSVIPKTWCI